MRSIVFDQNGICIDGEYRTLLASSLFYFRIPQERWEERMQLLKAAGYHAIDVYFPWNYHETAPGCWDFEGNRNVERFLRLAADNGLSGSVYLFGMGWGSNSRLALGEGDCHPAG